MQPPERRAALSAFLWTITVMAFAGGALMAGANIIPPAPTNVAAANADTTVVAYATALDTANARLTEAGTRITQLQNELAQRQNTAALADAAPAQPAPVETAVSAAQAVEYAKQIAGALQPTGDPELVDLDGQAVWAISYQPGTVYVNAQDGTIALVERNQPQGGRPNHHDDDDRHETDGNDD